MSFTCQHCNKVQPAGTKPNKTVTQTRVKRYPTRYSADGEHIIDKGGVGVETVEELNLCTACAEKVGTPVMVG